MKILENKVALVMGGTSGIGKATVIAFGVAGAKVVFSGRRKEEGENNVDHRFTIEHGLIQATEVCSLPSSNPSA